MPVDAARAVKHALRGSLAADADTSVDEEVGFLLLADLLQMLRDLHGAHFKVT